MKLLRRVVLACWESLVDLVWFVFAIWATLLIGRPSPWHDGAKVLVYAKALEVSDEPARIWRGRLSTFNYPQRTIYIRFRIEQARWHDDDCQRIVDVPWNERGTTWCFGWEGEAADALRAAAAMQ